jgi:hypothetical protein
MKLLWILYRGQKRTRYILFLSLGTRNDKIAGLDAKLVDDASREKILTTEAFGDLSLDAKIKWLKRYCPGTMKAAYRELIQNCIVSSTEYKMN